MDDKIAIEGRKTFFICPDASLFPEAYLEDYFTRGYETYIIDDDRICPIDSKVDIIIETFPDPILFFYIDSKVNGISWKTYISELQDKYQNKVLIGVLYEKRAREAEKLAIERYFLFELGLQCGCIALEYQKSKNLMKIDQVMFANQARGRRQHIRAICDPMSRIVFDYNGANYSGKILDVSTSHFSCAFDYTVPLKLSERIADVYFDINRLHMRSDALLCAKREMPNYTLYIFLFIKKDGSQGLEQETAIRVIQKIYNMVTSKTKSLLNAKFDDKGREIRAKKEHPVANDDEFQTE